MNKVRVIATGSYAPKRVLTNADLEKMVDTSDEWITTRTGIKERRIADKNTPTSELAKEAAKIALKRASLKASDIDMFIIATITPDMVFPSTAAIVSHKLGVGNKAIIDIEAACTGFIYGLSIATQYIRTGEYKYIMVIAAEELSKITDWEDRSTCILFGDGAGAAILGPTDGESDFLGFHLGGDGQYGDLLYLPAGGSAMPASHKTVDERLHYMKMKGNEVFKAAVNSMKMSANICLEKAGLKKEDIDLLIPHQANLRIINSLATYLKVPSEKVYINLDRYGNTSAATIPIAFDEAITEGKLKRGDNVMFVAFGGGFTWGSTIFKY